MPLRRMGSGSIDPRILDLGTVWRWVVSFTLLPLLPSVKECEDDKNPTPLPSSPKPAAILAALPVDISTITNSESVGGDSLKRDSQVIDIKDICTQHD
jgi:hypothetical protein